MLYIPCHCGKEQIPTLQFDERATGCKNDSINK